MNASQTSIVAASVLAVLAALCDWLTRRIPNVLTMGGILLGIALAVGTGAAEEGLRGAARGGSYALLGMAMCAAVPVVGFARGELGGGDVKLFAALGALLGPGLGFEAEGLTFALAIFLVHPFRLVRQQKLLDTLANGWTRLRNLFRRGLPPLPYRAVGLRPVIMGPTVLMGVCLAIARHGGVP